MVQKIIEHSNQYVNDLVNRYTRHLTGEFLSWVEDQRTYTIKLFRIASIVEDALLEQWRSEMYANKGTLDELALATYQRERLERWLNILDFGAEHGVNFQSPERKRLFQRWLQQTSTKQKN